MDKIEKESTTNGIIEDDRIAMWPDTRHNRVENHKACRPRDYMKIGHHDY